MGVAATTTDTVVGVADITTTMATVEGEEDTGGEGDTRREEGDTRREEGDTKRGEGDTRRGEGAIEPTKIGVTVIKMVAVIVNVQGDWFSVSGAGSCVFNVHRTLSSEGS